MEKDPFFHIPPNGEWNALIGRQGSSVSYAEGYIEAALELCKQVLQQNLYSQRDTLVMPILFNARHAIELHLKFVISELTNVGIIRDSHPVNHDIASHFLYLQSKCLPDRALRIQLDKLHPYVSSLSKIDDDGQEFRYFENSQGKRSLEDKALANILVIGVSLENVKEILCDLRYRIWSLCEEYESGTFTTKLSRRDLFEIVAMLPPRTKWRCPEFDEIKQTIRQDYELSNTQFSKALKLALETRELCAELGIETQLVHLTDEMAIFLAEQWCIIHPLSKKEEDVATFRSLKIEDLFRNRDQELAAFENVVETVPKDEFADAETVYYLARNGEFSESYELSIERKIEEYSADNDHPRNVQHLMNKTSFLGQFVKGLQILGRGSLADKILQRFPERFG